jgi:heptosyltransferase III
VLLAIPALRALRSAQPRDTLVVAAQPRIGQLLEILGVVDRSVDFETLGLDALFQETLDNPIREWPARCADDLRRATRVVAWVGSREPRFVKRLIELVPGSVVAPSVNAGRLVWEHLVQSTATVALGTDRALYAPVRVPAALAGEARHELRHLGWNGTDRLLVVHPGAGGQGKRWATSGFAAMLERLAAVPRLRVAVHQGPADHAAVATLPEPLTAAAIRLREPPLPLLAGMLTQATLYVGNDSGISHLAAAVGTRSVVLFGVDRLIWRPWAHHVEPLVVSLATADNADITRVMAAITSVLG